MLPCGRRQVQSGADADQLDDDQVGLVTVDDLCGVRDVARAGPHVSHQPPHQVGRVEALTGTLGTGQGLEVQTETSNRLAWSG